MVALGTLFALGMVGAGLAAYPVHNRVQGFSREFAGGLAQRIDLASAVGAAETMARMEDHRRLMSMDS